MFKKLSNPHQQSISKMLLRAVLLVQDRDSANTATATGAASESCC